MKVKNLKIGEKVIVKSLPSDPYFGVNVGDTVTIAEENSVDPWCITESGNKVAISVSKLKRINEKSVESFFIDSIISFNSLTAPVINMGTPKEPLFRNITPSIDQGVHYRKYHRVKLTDIDVERGFTEIQLDPFRLSSILGITDAAAFTVFKKSIRWGGSNAKDLKTDLKDIISACERKLEIIEEDEG